MFQGIKKLNRIQSIVYDAAYNSNENLLVSAPTGAGKTNIALMTITHEIRNNIKDGVVKKDAFKVYNNYIILQDECKESKSGQKLPFCFNLDQIASLVFRSRKF